MKSEIVSLMLVAGIFAGCSTYEKKDTRIIGSYTAPVVGTTFEELPIAVQKAIMAYSPTGKIDDIDRETRTGRVVYEITFAEPGRNPKLHIAEDGEIVQSDVPIVERSGSSR